MLIGYIQAAMRRAKYEMLEDDRSFFGSIPDLQGVWANEATLEECREELESAPEDWVLAGIWQHHSIPPIEEISLNRTIVPAEAHNKA
jgi:predicted RNase H-like HicB family nuclease